MKCLFTREARISTLFAARLQPPPGEDGSPIHHEERRAETRRRERHLGPDIEERKKHHAAHRSLNSSQTSVLSVYSILQESLTNLVFFRHSGFLPRSVSAASPCIVALRCQTHYRFFPFRLSKRPIAPTGKSSLYRVANRIEKKNTETSAQSCPPCL